MAISFQLHIDSTPPTAKWGTNQNTSASPHCFGNGNETNPYPHDKVEKNQDQDNLEESEAKDLSTDLVEYADAASGLELALSYVEQLGNVVPTDVMFIRHWRNFSSSAGLVPCVKS
ncbi:hypothetical protein AVEN_173523-1 [Araneus ventricosus]|uniref:Uncharacterized protein n=1 Tax=Araneus ventricosus TaxID=182803 RepID=A0A4Y2N178_ARAVE|nr:hypothetical protein AVEN_173523-1 [Araneus ventricosus]